MNTKRNVSGFSLIELVVVVAIIGLLATLLFPMLQKLKSSGIAGRCAGNLRTIGLAVHQYAAENQGQFPVSRLQYTMDANGNRKTVPFLPDALNEFLPVLDYTTPSSPWWCPGDTGRPVGKRKHSYGVNQHLGGDKANPQTWDGKPNPSYDPRFAFLQAVERPLSQIIYLVDYVDMGDAGKWSSAVVASRWPMKEGSSRENLPDARIDFSRHPRTANALFLDGSVRGLTFEDLVGTGTAHISPSANQ